MMMMESKCRYINEISHLTSVQTLLIVMLILANLADGSC
jgi:hypothetical protein